MTQPTKSTRECCSKRGSDNKLKNFLLRTLPNLLSTLFPRFAIWLTRSGTSTQEFLSSWALMGFGTVMMLNEKELIKIPSFKYFEPYPDFWPWACMFLLGLAQMYNTTHNSAKSNQVGGIMMMGAGVIWFIVAGTFGYNYPPISTAFPLYLGMGVVTGSVGYVLLNQGKEQQVLEETRSQ